MMNNNLILDTDSYKPSMWLQYPPGMEGMYAYVESRGGKYGQTVFMGLQYILKEHFLRPITKENVEEAKEFYTLHGEPFNYDGWMGIVNKHGGKLPITIKAVAEGTVVPTHNILMSVDVQNEFFWLGSHVETCLLRVWYPVTVATQSWHIKQLIKGYLEKTSDDPKAELPFKLHDFGSRGVSSAESAMIGGAAHLVNFMGSDTILGIRCANKYYNCKMSAFSIPAAEHSTITAWGKDREVDAYRNMLTQFAKPGSLVAVVSDSYDLWNAIEHIWGETLRDAVINSGATVIIRPDSGDPTTVVLRALELLEAKFGCSYNSKSYKVLNNVRIIQGDGVNEESIRSILEAITSKGYSATNVAFGMGGALLQQVNRDTQKFAYKCSEVTINKEAIPVCKNPITDPGKASKKGRLDLVRLAGEDYKFKTVTIPTPIPALGSVLHTVYKNGELLKDYTLDQVRKNSEM